ncbi:MAG: hypothetical protein WCF45_10720 [Photobacterium halotolerans]
MIWEGKRDWVVMDGRAMIDIDRAAVLGVMFGQTQRQAERYFAVDYNWTDAVLCVKKPDGHLEPVKWNNDEAE